MPITLARPHGPFLLLSFLVCVAALSVAFCQAQIIDGDYWWYLASGKLIAEGGIPSTNTFSFTHPDSPWHFTQWLFALGLHLVETVGGQRAVEALSLLVWCAPFLLTLDTIRLKKVRLDPWMLLPLMLLALWASSLRFIIRPHLASLFFLALLLNLLERKPRRLNLLLFALAVTWANVHAGFFFGLVTCCAFAAGSFLARDSQESRLYGKALLWFFLGTLLNVNVFSPYYYVVSNLWVSQLAPVAEMAGVGAGTGDGRYMAFWMIVAFVGGALPLLIKGRDYRTVLLFLAFLPLAIFAVRLVPKMILLVLPGACSAVLRWLPTTKRAYWLFVLILWVAAGVSFAWSRIPAPVPEWGINNREVPVAAADFIADTSLMGNMYNGFDEGGYLSYRFYPSRRVFIDGRVQAYPAAFFQEYYQANSVQRWQGLMDEHEVAFALIRRQISGDRETFNRGAFLEALGWPLIHVDGKYLIYARSGMGNDRVIDEHQFKVVSWGSTAEELKSQARRDPAQMLREIRRIPVESLRLRNDVLRFADAAFYAGDAALCERILQHGRDTIPGSEDLLLKLAALHATQGRIDLAASELLLLISQTDDPKLTEQATALLGRIKTLQHARH